MAFRKSGTGLGFILGGFMLLDGELWLGLCFMAIGVALCFGMLRDEE